MGDLTLVFTMGRVGSSAAYRALAGNPGQVFHLQSLAPSTLEAWRGRPDEAPRHVQESLHAVDALEAHDGRVRVVTLVRDAVERNLSAAYAVWRRRHRGADLQSALADGSVAERWGSFNLGLPLRWFDAQLASALGVDPWAHEFPDTGYSAFLDGRFEVLVLRSDLGNDLKGELLSEFTGHPTEVQTVNASSSEDGELYEQFCDRVPLTEEWLRSVAESRYMQHFFAPDPETYVKRWRADARPGPTA